MKPLNQRNQSTIPNHIASMAKTIIRINRMATLKEHGFTEQNNIVRYQQKLKDNKLAQTVRKSKTFADKARAFRDFADRCVGLA
jgi:hypothetical protein